MARGRFSDLQIQAMREDWKQNGIPYSRTQGVESFAKKYGVDPSLMHKIVSGNCYKGAPGPRHCGMPDFEPSEVLEIRTRLRAGEDRRRLAEHYGVSTSTIKAIHHGRNWKHLQFAKGV